MKDLYLKNRDPNELNSHIQIRFEDIFGEPEGVRSMSCIWENIYEGFECSKNLCYKFMTCLCGLCIALEWGCEFAMLTFNHVWCGTPCLRDISITTGCAQKFFGNFFNCCLVPVCDACAASLSRIKISKN